MLLSTAIKQAQRNPGITHLVDVHLFTVEFATKRVTDHSTKVKAIVKINALVPPQDLSKLCGFNFEIIANATGIARQKVINFRTREDIYIDVLNQVAALPGENERRDAMCNLVLKSLARMQYLMIMAEINKGKGYSELQNNKVYAEWKRDKPLKPDAEGLVDSTNIIDATYQIVSDLYIDAVTYLLNIIQANEKLAADTAA